MYVQVHFTRSEQGKQKFTPQDKQKYKVIKE